jgi:hypothetical protein
LYNKKKITDEGYFLGRERGKEIFVSRGVNNVHTDKHVCISLREKKGMIRVEPFQILTIKLKFGWFWHE